MNDDAVVLLTPRIASAAFLIAERARATILSVLLDGSSLPAGELAYAAGITPQTASAHLAKLMKGGLLVCETQGRHRYYRLPSSDVAEILEHLAVVGYAKRVRLKPRSRQARELQFARHCYDHLAGRLGVLITQALQSRGYLRSIASKQFEITTAGAEWFAKIGVKVEELHSGHRGLARQCLDWTERVHHLAGPLGVRLLAAMCDAGWLRRSRASRCLYLTPTGVLALKRELGVTI